MPLEPFDSPRLRAQHLGRIEQAYGGAALLTDVARVLRARAKLIAAAAMIGAVAAAAGSMLKPVEYVAESKFLSEYGNVTTTGRLAGLAAQFGINVPQPNAPEPPEFFIALFRTQQLLRSAAASTYTAVVNGTASRRSLPEILGLTRPTGAPDTVAAAGWLSRSLDVRLDPKVGMITLRVTGPSRPLVIQLSRRLISLANEANVARRQGQANAEKDFIGARMAEASRELRDAEEQLRRFLEQNRGPVTAPQLTLEQNRIQRRVDMRQQIYTSLAQAYEEARIAEVRNTPVLSVIEAPEFTASRRGPRPVFFGILGAFSGFVLSILWFLALGKGAGSESRQRDLATPTAESDSSVLSGQR